MHKHVARICMEEQGSTAGVATKLTASGLSDLDVRQEVVEKWNLPNTLATRLHPTSKNVMHSGQTVT